MTYREKYFQIIEYRKNNQIEDDVYSEKHHIVPKSICPLLKKSKDNLVRLTAEEHFKVHYYLWKWFKEELNEKKWSRKMCFAFISMKKMICSSDDIEKLSKIYAEIRKDFRKVMSEAKKNLSVEARQNMSNAQKGKHHSEETKRKMSESRKGVKNPNFGKHWNEEQRNKASIQQIIRFKNPSNKEYMRKSKTEETKRKLSESHFKKPIIQIDVNGNVIKEWKSSREIERTTGISHNNISRCCRKLKHYYTAGGYIWRFKEENPEK